MADRREDPGYAAGFDVDRGGADPARMCLITRDGVTTVEFVLEPSVSLRCARAEGVAALALHRWLRDVDPCRYFELRVAFLQFEYNPGRESFAADEVRALCALLEEQRGTERWNAALARLLARLEACAAEL
ncbi:hypothetical protein [Actinacidiphila sp. bgisy167]|uniref:hypothetical protein n=1 Tax=Actinacidiphila sp. bgisy167 TaxID=3413797 RepID=UPI003D7202DD